MNPAPPKKYNGAKERWGESSPLEHNMVVFKKYNNDIVLIWLYAMHIIKLIKSLRGGAG